MRGDSLRDLYAKTLALVGLGLLAGVGALVDYWPVGGSTPQVAALQPVVPEALVARAATDVPVAVRISEPAEAAPVAAPNLALLAVAGGGFPTLGRRLELEAPAVSQVLPASAEPVEPVADPVPVVALAEPVPSPGPDFDPALVYQLGTREDDSGLLSDAVDMMKTTGSTIARGGAATGASIVGAFRVVSGAFKKLKFF